MLRGGVGGLRPDLRPVPLSEAVGRRARVAVKPERGNPHSEGWRSAPCARGVHSKCTSLACQCDCGHGMAPARDDEDHWPVEYQVIHKGATKTFPTWVVAVTWLKDKPDATVRGVYRDRTVQDLTREARGEDSFKITAVGMARIAASERRAFLLRAEQSAQEAELLRKEGDIVRAKKFLDQEAKWRVRAAQSDEIIYRDYKTQGRDSRSSIGANTLKMAAQAMKQALAEGKNLAEATQIYHKTLSQLLSGGRAKDSAAGTGVLALLALLAWYALHRPAKPVNYDLTTYQPEPRSW